MQNFCEWGIKHLLTQSLCVVFFSGSEILVGHKAVLQADHNPTNTLYDAKRFIGKQFATDELNAEASRYPFKVDTFNFCCAFLVYLNHSH